ncbi:hypothetical protein OIU79_009377 [Salix purpurea]|uniref:Uncharacterized protein n=1 Tax=Salix purpurea TaxID=77065 RepID=A0A9Q0TKP5_SALPP|nr:hypothetical protein OIU79_009377 [Salix purpurea]
MAAHEIFSTARVLVQIQEAPELLVRCRGPSFKMDGGAASRYNDLEDTLARANAWLCASQASGVPVVFTNIQTESLLTKISGETASSTVNAGSLSDFSGLANVSLYGFEDYHGVDLGVVRAARLWYAPLCGEFAIEVRIKEDDTKLGFAISRTEEGFIYISSVLDDDENVPSTRSGLSNLYKEAKSASRLLVVSRVSNQKVPILIHVFSWDRALPPPSAGSGRFRSVCRPPVMAALPTEIQLTRQPGRNQIQPLTAADIPNDGVLGNEADIRLDRDTAGETSFRFHCFSLPNN